MTQEQIEQLRQNVGKVVNIHCSDGELLEAKILHVDDEYSDVVYHLVSSSTPEKYKQGIPSAYVISWEDIIDFQ